MFPIQRTNRFIWFRSTGLRQQIQFRWNYTRINMLVLESMKHILFMSLFLGDNAQYHRLQYMTNVLSCANDCAIFDHMRLFRISSKNSIECNRSVLCDCRCVNAHSTILVFSRYELWSMGILMSTLWIGIGICPPKLDEIFWALELYFESTKFANFPLSWLFYSVDGQNTINLQYIA